MIRKIHKNNRNKTDTCLEGWGVGDTHFTGSHIGGIHISLGICVRGYTYHGDTHITVTPGGLALGRGTLGTRNKLVRRMNGAEPAVRGS